MQERSAATGDELLPCTCHYGDEPYCPRHTPLPGEKPDATTTCDCGHALSTHDLAEDCLAGDCQCRRFREVSDGAGCAYCGLMTHVTRDHADGGSPEWRGVYPGHCINPERCRGLTHCPREYSCVE